MEKGFSTLSTNFFPDSSVPTKQFVPLPNLFSFLNNCLVSYRLESS